MRIRTESAAETITGAEAYLIRANCEEDAVTRIMQVFGFDDPTDKMANICAPEYREKVERILHEVSESAYEAGYSDAQMMVSEWNKP
jgi:hypothetical protein